MTVDLPTYIPLNEATRRYRIGAQALTQMIEKGTIRAVKIDGSMAVAETDVKNTAYREKFQHLDGHPIHLSGAARKYDLPRGSLSRWATAGYIEVIGSEKNRRLLNKADVAYIRALIESTGGPRKGRALSRILPE